VHTAHHSVALRVKSVLEGENAEGETMQEASQEEQNSTLTCSTNDTEACAERPSRSMPTEVTAHVKPSWDNMGTLSFPEPYSRYRVCAFPTQKPALMPVQETGTAEQPPRTAGNTSNTALAPGRLVPASALLGMHPRGHARCIADN